jgi:DNA-binding NtrC family response regulator
MAHDILIVDDEPDIRSLIDGILADEGFETRQAHNSDAALAHFRARRRASSSSTSGWPIRGSTGWASWKR